MADLDAALGALLIGTWLNMMLFMLELTQLWKYIRLFPTDRFLIRVLVGFMFAVDCLATANACAMVYMYTITNWGDTNFIAQQNATIPVYSITFGVSTLTMHCFLIYRYFALSRNRLLAAALLVLAGTAFTGDALATWSVIKYTALTDRPKLKTHATIWLTTAVGTDVGIAAALVWELSRVKSAFAHTNSLLRRLIGTTIMTGAATATLAMLALTTYLARPDANFCLTFGFCIGRACTLTVLYNLNMRKANGRFGSSSGHGGGAGGASQTIPLDTVVHFAHGGASGTYGSVVGGPGAGSVPGTISIGVHQTAVVHVDGDKPDRASFDGAGKARLPFV